MDPFTEKGEKDQEPTGTWTEGSIGAPPIIEGPTLNRLSSNVSLDKDSDSDVTEHVFKHEEIANESLMVPALVDWDTIPNDLDKMATQTFIRKQTSELSGGKNQEKATEATKRRCDKKKSGSDEDEETAGTVQPKRLPPSLLSHPVHVLVPPGCSFPKETTVEGSGEFATTRKDIAQGDSRGSLMPTQVFHTMITPSVPEDCYDPTVVKPASWHNAWKKTYRKEHLTDGSERPMHTRVGVTSLPEVTGPGSIKPLSPSGENWKPTMTAFATVEPQSTTPECINLGEVNQACDPHGQEPLLPLMAPCYPGPPCPVQSPQLYDGGVLLAGPYEVPPLAQASPEFTRCPSSGLSSLWTPEKRERRQYGVTYPWSEAGFLPEHYAGYVPEDLWYSGWQRSTPRSGDPQACGGVPIHGNLRLPPQHLAAPALAHPRLGALWTTLSDMCFPEPISLQEDKNFFSRKSAHGIMQQPTRTLTAGVYRKSSTSRSPHPSTQLPCVQSNTENLPKWGITITESGEVAPLPQKARRHSAQAKEAIALSCDKSIQKGRRSSRNSMCIKGHSRRPSFSHRQKTQPKPSLHGDKPAKVDNSLRVSGPSRRKSVADEEVRPPNNMPADKWPEADHLHKPVMTSHPNAKTSCSSKHHNPCHSTFHQPVQQHHSTISGICCEDSYRCQSAPPFHTYPSKQTCMVYHMCHHGCNRVHPRPPASHSAALLPTTQTDDPALVARADEAGIKCSALPHVCMAPRAIVACSSKQIPDSVESRDACNSSILPALRPATRSITSMAPARRVASQWLIWPQASNADLYFLVSNTDGQDELYRARRISPVLRLKKGHAKPGIADNQPRRGASIENDAVTTLTRKSEVRNVPMTAKLNDLRRPSGRCSLDSSTSHTRVFSRPKQQKVAGGEGKHEIGVRAITPTRQQLPPIRPSVSPSALDLPPVNKSHVDTCKLAVNEMAYKQQGVFPEPFFKLTKQEINERKPRSVRPSLAAVTLDTDALPMQQTAQTKIVPAEEPAFFVREQGLPLKRMPEAMKQDGNGEAELYTPIPHSAQPSMACAEHSTVEPASLLVGVADVTGGNAVDKPEPCSMSHYGRPSMAYAEHDPAISARLQGGPAKTVTANEQLYSTSQLRLHSKRLSGTTGQDAIDHPDKYSMRSLYVGHHQKAAAKMLNTLPEEVEHGHELPSMHKQERLPLKLLSQATERYAIDKSELRYVRPSRQPSVVPAVFGPIASAKQQNRATNSMQAEKHLPPVPNGRLHLKRLSETKGRDAISHAYVEDATSLPNSHQKVTKTSGRNTQSLKRLSTVPEEHGKAEPKYLKDIINTLETPRSSIYMTPSPENSVQECINEARPDSVSALKMKEINSELTSQLPFATPLQGDESNERGDQLHALSSEHHSDIKNEENDKEVPALRSPRGTGLVSLREDDDAVDFRMTMALPSLIIDSQSRRQPPGHQTAPFNPRFRFALVVGILCFMLMFALYMLMRKVYPGKLAQRVEVLREHFQTVHYIPAAEVSTRLTTTAPTNLPLEIELCTTPLCIQEGNRLKQYITRDMSPCSNFYRYVCSKNVEMTTMQPLVSGASSSADTLMEEYLASGLRDFILDEHHKDVTLVRALYKACVRPSGNTVAFLQREVFATLPIKKWPCKDSIFLATEIWRMAGLLIRRYGIISIIEVSVGVHRDGIRPTVELSYPKYLYLEDYSLSEVNEWLRSAVVEAARELGSAEVDSSLENLVSQISSVARSLANLRGNRTVRQVIFAKFEDIEDNINLFLRSIFEDDINEGTAVVIRDPRLLIDQLQALASSASVTAFLNYLGFRILVFFAALFDPHRAKSLRKIISIELTERLLSPPMGWLLCLRLVESVQPTCLIKAQAIHQATSRATIASRRWLARLEGQLYRNLPFISWVTDRSLKIFSHRLSRLHIVRFFESSPLDEDLCTLKPFDTINEGGSLQMFARAAGRYHRERLRQIKKSRPLTPGSAFSSDSRYNDAAQVVHVPVGLVNSSLIADSSLIAFHASRTAVRLYKGLLPVAYEQWDSNHDAESQWLLDTASRRRLARLLDCLERDFSALPNSLQPSWPGVVRDASEVRYPLLAHTTALALAFAAFKALLNADHNRRLDIRLQPLSSVSSEQLFFIYYALDNCERSDEQYQARQFRAWRRLPPEHRVNLPLRHLPQFAHAFRCSASDGSSSKDGQKHPMAAPDKSRCDVLRWNMSLVQDSRRRHGPRNPLTAPFGHAKLAGTVINVPDNSPSLAVSAGIVERPAVSVLG